MRKRLFPRRTDPDFGRRVATLLLGAIPASLFSGVALASFVFGLLMLPSPTGLFLALYGSAGVLGTYALWMISFGFWSVTVRIGLIAGIVAMLPVLAFPSFSANVTAQWVGTVAAYALMAGPVFIAFAWFFLFARTTLRQPQTFRESASAGVAVAVSLAVPALAIFAPIWATPLAKFWYERGFEEDVTSAIAAIDAPNRACIYDDSRHLFVNSVQQLDSATMIERAVREHSPRIRLNRRQRDPHFRVYAGGQTYYWSFRNRELHAFRGERWTLAHTIRQMCAAYRRNPHSVQQAYVTRGSILPNEVTLCCNQIPDGQ